MTTSNVTPARQPAGTPAGGEFTTSAHAESPTVLTSPAAATIERMIARGDLSPAARGMDPRDAIEQWAEANGAPWEDRVIALRAAGLNPVVRGDELQPGDLLQVGELTGRDDVTLTLDENAGAGVTAVAIAETKDRTSTTVTHYVRDENYWRNVGTLTVETNAELEIDPSPDRCSSCGRDAGGGDGSDGRCGNCADALDTDDED